jgi:hypothetical protein
VSRDDLVAQQDKTMRDARIGDGFLVAAVVGAGVSAYLTLSRSSWNAKVAEQRVDLQVSPTGVSIAGTF